MSQVIIHKGFPSLSRSWRVACNRPRGALLYRLLAAQRSAPLLVAFFSAFLALLSPATAVERDPEAFSRLYFGLQPPTNRDAERAVELVEELIARRRFGEAAPIIADQLAAAADCLDSEGRSLKTRLVGALAEVGPAGETALQAVLRGAYQRRLAEAASPADLRALVASHPPEIFGTETLVRLAEVESDRGAYAAAAVAYAFAESLERLAERDAGARRLAERATANRLRQVPDAALGDPDRDPPSLLRGATAAAARDGQRLAAPANWLGPGGDPRRQAIVPGDEPIAWRAWRATLPIDPEAADAEPRFRTQATIAVDGVLVTRSPRGLLAFGVESGKRLWSVKFRNQAGARRDSDACASFGIASDSRRVFAVAPSGVGPRDRFDRSRSSLPNALVAYDLSSGGKLVWRLDGGDAEGLAAGARFLGPPAPSDGRLHTLAEIDQAICLVQIDAGTGEPEWVQPLMRSERNDFRAGSAVAVTPTRGERLVYCPTGRGAVVAVDPLLRRLAWVHYLEIDADAARPPRRNGWRGGFRGRVQQDDADAWRHCRVIERAGRLAVVSPASQSLQVLDAATGASVWGRKLAGAWILAAGLGDDVLTVDADRVRSHSLEDGRPRWSAPLPPGESPGGEGLLLSDRYLLPLDSGRLARIDLGDAGAAERVQPLALGLNPLEEPVALGELIAHRGAIFSRSAGSIERFDQRGGSESGLTEVDRRISAGDARGVLELLSETPTETDRRVAERRAIALLQLARDESGAGVAARESAVVEVPRLVAGRRATAEVAVLRVRNALAEGEAGLAAEALVRLAAGPASRVVLSPESGWRVEALRLAGEAYREAADSPASDDTAEAAEAAESLRTALAGLSDPTERSLAAERLGPFLAQNADSTPARSLATRSPRDDAWSLRRVTARVNTEPTVEPVTSRSTRRSRRDAAVARRRLRLTDGVGAPTVDSTWSIVPRGGTTLLVGANRWGEPLFAVEVPLNLNARSTAGEKRVGAARDRLGRGRLALRLEEGFAVYGVDGAPDRPTNREPLAWRSTRRATGGWRSVSDGFDANEEPIAIGPWGVVSLAGSTLWLRDLDSGERRWSRTLDPLGPGPYLVLAEADELHVAARGDQGARFSAWSGERSAGPWSLPPAKTWRSRVGANLLVEGRSLLGRELRLIAIAGRPDADPLWRREFPPRVLLAATAEGLLLALESGQELSAIDLRTGVERFAVTLPGAAAAPVRALRVEAIGDRLLIEVDRSNPAVDRAGGARSIGGRPLLTGELYCLDATTGASVWAAPAQVAAMSRLPTPIDPCPLILLARRQQAESEGGEPTIALAALDPRSGACVYRADALPDSEDPRAPEVCEVRLEEGPDECLQVRLGRAWLMLQPTGRPSPPGPPMAARVEDPYDRGPKSAAKGFDRLLKSIFEPD